MAAVPDLTLPAENAERFLITAEQRKQLLGRLAEFELALLNLPPREQGFVLAYVADPTNGKRAAIKAGMPEKGAAVQATKLLNVPRVAHAIALGNLIREDRTFVTSERTIHELALLAFSNIDDYEVEDGRVRVREGVPEQALRAVQSVEHISVDHYDDKGRRTHTTHRTRLRLWSKTDTLRMLAMFQKLIANPSGPTVINNNTMVVNQWDWGNKKLTF